MESRRMRALLFGSAAACGLLAASSGGALAASEIDDLKSQIRALQDRVSQMERDKGAAREESEKRGRLAPAAAVEAGAKPKTWKLPGTNTSMNIGGYAKLDFIYDINNFIGDSAGFRSIPLDNTAAANRQGNARLHARQSRVYFKTWTPTDFGELFTHIEGDFEGTGGNQVISNSTSFRLRHAYGRLGPLLAGQTWTTFMDVSALAETIDFNGASGESFIRQGQIRYTHSLGDRLGLGGSTAVSFAVENPEPVVTPGAGGLAITRGPDQVPDFVVSARQRLPGGHVYLAAVFRRPQVDDGAGISDETFGYGIHVSGVYKITKRDTIGAEFNYGDGIGRYLLEVGASQGAAVLNGNTAAAASLDTITAFGGFGWIQHKWTDTIRTNLVYGRTQLQTDDEFASKAAVTPGINKSVTSVHANLIWSPVPQVNMGVEYIYGFRAALNSSNGKASRVQVGIQYKF